MNLSDVKEAINQMVSSISEKPELMAQFRTNPIQAVETVFGVDLPDDIVEKIVSGVKAKLTSDNLSGAADALKKLF